MGPGMPGQPGPYAYPQSYAPQPPSAPRTLGLLSIIFGSVVGAFSFFGLIGGSAGLAGMMLRGMPNTGSMSAMQDYLEAIRVPSMIHSLVFVAMSAWLLALGVGQRRYRAWAARQSVLWGVLGLVAIAGVCVMQFAVIGPAAERMFAEMSHHARMTGGVGAITRMATLLGLAFYLPYPIIMIVTFRKPDIVAAMNT